MTAGVRSRWVAAGLVMAVLAGATACSENRSESPTGESAVSTSTSTSTSTSAEPASQVQVVRADCQVSGLVEADLLGFG